MLNFKPYNVIIVSQELSYIFLIKFTLVQLYSLKEKRVSIKGRSALLCKECALRNNYIMHIIYVPSQTNLITLKFKHALRGTP